MSLVSRLFPGAPPDGELTPCNYVLAEGLIEGDPQEREHVYFASDAFTVAVWEAQPYAERIDSYPGDEFAHVIRGRLTLTDPDGTSQTFGEGESYLMRAGWSGEFRVEESFMKYFALSIPQGGAQ
jgi:uncharacterized cupin superfamily protein